jgi:hypothetical protein
MGSTTPGGISSGQCRGHTRHGRVCRGKHSALVEIGRVQELSGGWAITHLWGCWGEQRQSPARLETPLAADGGSDPDTHHGLSLPSGNQQVEQDRAPAFLVISLNWRGQPLINYETIINLIGGTKTRTGIKVKAVLDTNEYETGIKVSDEQLGEIQLRRHKVHPAWNYTISPRGHA